MTQKSVSFVCSPRLARFAICCLLLTGIVGCGGAASVTGSVTFKPKAKKLVWGSVTMIGRDNIPRHGMITPEGTYTVNGLPAGPVKILVSSDDPKGESAAARGGRRTAFPEQRTKGEPGGAEDKYTPVPAEIVKGWFPIPEKYADITKSPLTTTLTRGQNIYDILLD